MISPKMFYKYMLFISLRSGVTIDVDKDGDKYSSFDDYEIDRIYDYFMHVRKSNYNFYLDMLSNLVFTNYSSLNFDIEMTEAFDYKRQLTRKEWNIEGDNDIFHDGESLLSLYNDPTKQEERIDLIDYINRCSDVKEFDLMLHKNKDIFLLKELIRNSVESVIECDYDLNCFGVLSSLDYINVLKKFQSEDNIENVINVAVKYALENDGVALMDYVDEVYAITENIYLALKMNKFFIKESLKYKSLKEIKKYVTSVVVFSYIRVKIHDKYEVSTKKEKEFLKNIENDKDYIYDLCKGIVLGNINNNAIDMFLKYHYIGDALTYCDNNGIDEEELKVDFSRLHFIDSCATKSIHEIFYKIKNSR